MAGGSDRVCPRCGAPASGSRWCSGCGLNLANQQALPTAEEYSAAAREREWLAEQERKDQAHAPQQAPGGDATGPQQSPPGDDKSPTQPDGDEKEASDAEKARRRPTRRTRYAASALAVLGFAVVAWYLTTSSSPQRANQRPITRPAAAPGPVVPGTTLTIYSSLPLQGTSREQSQSVIRGERLALDELAPGGQLGRWTITYVSLDDSSAENRGTADETQTATNANRAAADPTAIFYLGEFNSGGSKISIPILNKARVPQISPSNTYTGLTTGEPGSEPGEPAKYYPTGIRTYARILPRDTVQGAALVTLMKEDGCNSVSLWNDGSLYGAGLARNIELSAQKAQIAVRDKQRTNSTGSDYRALAVGIRSDCFLWSGVTSANAVQVFTDAAAACDNCKLYGPDGVAEQAFTDPAQGGIAPDVGARTKMTVATIGVRDMPAAAPIVSALTRSGSDETVDPYAIYGYETMALALDVLTRAGAHANRRQKVVETLFQTRNRAGAFGTYSIDKNGDTTLADYGVYEVDDGLPTYTRKVAADKGFLSG